MPARQNPANYQEAAREEVGSKSSDVTCQERLAGGVYEVTVEESLRKQLISALERLGRRYPSMRFGQLVCFAAFLARGPLPTSTWDAGDEEMLRAVLDHLAGHPGP